MNVSMERTEQRVTIMIAGDIFADQSLNVFHQWSQAWAKEPSEMVLNMRQIEEIDAVMVAELCRWLRERATDGLRTTLIAPPQMLAHTLYKVGSISGDQRMIRIEESRTEEPYAG